MSNIENTAHPQRTQRSQRPWRWIALAGVVCVLAWIALAIGLVMDVDRGTRLILVTIAAVATEGLVWLSAALLGLRVFEARQHLWRKLRGAFR